MGHAESAKWGICGQQTRFLVNLLPGSKLCTTFLNTTKHCEVMPKFQFTVTGAKLANNWKFCYFVYVQNYTIYFL